MNILVCGKQVPSSTKVEVDPATVVLVRGGADSKWSAQKYSGTDIEGLGFAIRMAFMLDLPANEIVLPIVLMGYLSGSSLAQVGGIVQLFRIFATNG